MGVQSFLLKFRVGRAKLERLEAKIASAERDIAARVAVEETARWLAPAREALAEARRQVDARRYDAAWEHLHKARQLEVVAYGDAELRSVAHSLRAEAAVKLSGWRQVAITEQLAPLLACEKATDDERQILAHAMRDRDEHFDNQYFKLRLVQKQVALLLKLLALALALFGLLFYFKHPTLTAPGMPLGPAKLLAALLLGAVGACFSGLLSLVSTSPEGSIPERVASSSVTLARPAIGGASGFAAALLLSAGILGQLPATTMLAVAFAFGFSERLAIGALEKVTAR